MAEKTIDDDPVRFFSVKEFESQAESRFQSPVSEKVTVAGAVIIVPALTTVKDLDLDRGKSCMVTGSSSLSDDSQRLSGSSAPTSQEAVETQQREAWSPLDPLSEEKELVRYGTRWCLIPQETLVCRDQVITLHIASWSSLMLSPSGTCSSLEPTLLKANFKNSCWVASDSLFLFSRKDLPPGS